MGFAIPLMLVNLFICWLWLNFIGMRLFGPGRQTSYEEKENNDGENMGGYVNYKIKSGGKENQAPKKSSLEEKEAAMLLEDLSPNKSNKDYKHSNSGLDFSRHNSKNGLYYCLKCCY